MVFLEVLVAVLLHQLGDCAVRRAELHHAGVQRREYLATELPDLLRRHLDIIHFRTPVMDAGTRARQRRLFCALALYTISARSIVPSVMWRET